MPVFKIKAKIKGTDQTMDLEVGKPTRQEAIDHINQLPGSRGAPKGFEVVGEPEQPVTETEQK